MAQAIRMKSREARDNIASLLKSVVSNKARYDLTLRGRVITVLGPLSDLTDDIAGLERVSATDIKNGKRSLIQVGFGARIVTRNRIDVAALLPAPDTIQRIADFSPSRQLLDTLTGLTRDIEELKLLDEAKLRRVDFRSRLDKAIKRRLDLLKASGSDVHAKFQKEFDEIDRDF